MRQLGYWLVQTLRSIRSDLLIQLAATGSIAVGLLLVGLALLGVVNLDRLTRSWGDGLQITAYLKPDADEGQVARLNGALEEHPLVSSVDRVSSGQAYTELRKSLGERSSLLAGVEKDFLPASLEIGLKQTDQDHLRPLIAMLNAASVVEEVDYMGRWVQRLTSLVSLLRVGVLGIALIICLACLYIISSTIRLGVFARRDDIQILKLVGATDRYVRAPFMIEGAIQGVMGALVACGLLFVVFHFSAPRFEDLLASAFSQISLSFFSVRQVLLGMVAAAMLGVVGSRLALGKYMDI